MLVVRVPFSDSLCFQHPFHHTIHFFQAANSVAWFLSWKREKPKCVYLVNLRQNAQDRLITFFISIQQGLVNSEENLQPFIASNAISNVFDCNLNFDLCHIYT